MMKKSLIAATAMLMVGAGSLQAQLKLQSDNVDEILKAMTLEEKVRLIIGANAKLDDGAGDVGNSGGRRVPGAAGDLIEIVVLQRL